MRQALFVFAIAVLLTMAVTALASAACNSCALGMGVCGYNTSGCRPAQSCNTCNTSCNTCAPACPPVVSTCAPACPPVVTTCAPACPPVVTTVAPACPPVVTTVAPACAPVITAAVPACNTCAPQVMGYCSQPTNGCGRMPTQRWTANLASVGASACAPVGSGDATFQLTKECDKLRYWVNVCEMSNVTRAEVRLVTNGCDLASAPVVATLYNGDGGCGCASGRLARGNISACDLQGPFQGQPLSALLTALTNGTAVISVATCANPCAEIAGLAGCETGQAPC